jgi:hypothetical protein
MFRHQRPMAADFLGLEKVVAANRFRQTGKNLMMIDTLQQLIDDELNDRVSTYGHRGLQRMANVYVAPSAYSFESQVSRKHFDPTHGYVTKRVRGIMIEREWNETFNPIMQAVMGLIDRVEIRSNRVQILRHRGAGKSMPLEVLLRDHGHELHRWVPRPYQEPLIYDTEIGHRIPKLH